MGEKESGLSERESDKLSDLPLPPLHHFSELWNGPTLNGHIFSRSRRGRTDSERNVNVIYDKKIPKEYSNAEFSVAISVFIYILTTDLLKVLVPFVSYFLALFEGVYIECLPRFHHLFERMSKENQPANDSCLVLYLVLVSLFRVFHQKWSEDHLKNSRRNQDLKELEFWNR